MQNTARSYQDTVSLHSAARARGQAIRANNAAIRELEALTSLTKDQKLDLADLMDARKALMITRR